METYARWEPVAGVTSPCGILLEVGPSTVTARLRFSAVGAAPRDLLLTFAGRVVACMSHEEFAHPWHAEELDAEVPRLDGRWARYAFPLLEVRNSRWLASFSDSQILDPDRPGLTHYRLVSLDNTVDVLAAGGVAAAWVSPAS
jgi:hypothetical protein